MKWITRAGVKVDRVGCVWLIRRFLDPEAEFVFLPEDTDWERVRGEGLVFDAPGAVLGNHGEVSFISMARQYGLTEPALALVGEIVRAAHPAAEGLHWIVSGLASLKLADRDMLERGCLLYDALYAECRQQSLARSPAAK